MEFINLHVSVLDSVEFLQATDAQRSTWLCLYRFCAGQENGGRLERAGQWSGRLWAQLGRVSVKVVKNDSPLWSWEDDTLVLRFYNADKEADVRRLRSQAAAAAHSRWHRKGMPDGKPEGMPDGIPSGTSEGNGIGNAEGKGKEGKGKEYTPAADAGHAEGQEKQPKRERSRKPGSVLPGEQSADVCNRMLEVGALMGRRSSTPWTAAEFEAFKTQRLDSCSHEDFAAQVEQLRPYYTASIPREKDFRRRELATLLNHWPGELDKARAWLRDNDDGVRKV